MEPIPWNSSTTLKTGNISFTGMSATNYKSTWHLDQKDVISIRRLQRTQFTEMSDSWQFLLLSLHPVTKIWSIPTQTYV